MFIKAVWRLRTHTLHVKSGAWSSRCWGLCFCLQRSFFVCRLPFLLAAFAFWLQGPFSVCSAFFLLAAILFCLQRVSCGPSYIQLLRAEMLKEITGHTLESVDVFELGSQNYQTISRDRNLNEAHRQAWSTHLKSSFPHGIAEVLVTDNGTQFSPSELGIWAQDLQPAVSSV